jgi:hypothetical protein
MLSLMLVDSALLAAVVVWRLGAIGCQARRHAALERIALEDSLEHLHAREVRGRLATRESMAAPLGRRSPRRCATSVPLERRG